jgi:hypothetical protein
MFLFYCQEQPHVDPDQARTDMAIVGFTPHWQAAINRRSCQKQQLPLHCLSELASAGEIS